MAFDPVFVGDILVCKNTAIAIRFIESMGFSEDDEDRIVEKLKSDRFLEIKTVSGQAYTISVREQLAQWQQEYPKCDFEKWRIAIYERWKHSLTGKS